MTGKSVWYKNSWLHPSSTAYQLYQDKGKPGGQKKLDEHIKELEATYKKLHFTNDKMQLTNSKS